MNCYLDLFTWKTWQEFVDNGGTISGFRKNRWRTVQKMRKGDLLLCYMTGISRFFAVLEVTGEPFQDDTPIWEEVLFPSRVPVRIVLELPPENAVPVKSLSESLSYFQDMKSPHSWTGHFRGSPTREKPEDAQVIIRALEESVDTPIFREYDPAKLDRKVPVYETNTDSVTVPDDSYTGLVEQNNLSTVETTQVSHEEIQWLLLDLGSQLGLDVWVARNDKGKIFNNQIFSDMPNMREALPTQFDDATNRTIELIDVLWLKENAIIAAFEIEHTTSIYSGLLRMSDLVSMQPNIKIPLYIVAPDERRQKVITEVNRPTFARLHPPLTEICQFIPYTSLIARLEQARDFLPYMRPEFLEDIAESLEVE